jgi:hypothetical protein
MEDLKNAGVPIWVSLFSVFTGEQHHVRPCSRVHRVLFPSIVICSIIYPDDTMAVHTVVDDDHICSLLIGELVFIAIIFKIKKTSKKMI